MVGLVDWVVYGSAWSSMVDRARTLVGEVRLVCRASAIVSVTVGQGSD